MQLRGWRLDEAELLTSQENRNAEHTVAGDLDSERPANRNVPGQYRHCKPDGSI